MTYVTHDSSVSTLRFERMPPQAMALALLIHALVALALWQMSQQSKRLPPPPEPIEVTIDQPPPQLPKVEPPKPEEAKPQQPTPPATPGIRPPAELTAENPTQVKPPDPQPPKLTDTPPEPAKPTEVPQQSASAAPRTEPQPEPPKPQQQPPPPTQARPEPPRPTPPQQQPPPRPAPPQPQAQAPAPPANPRGNVPAPAPHQQQQRPAPAPPAPSPLAPSPLSPSANHSTRNQPRQLPPYVARMEEKTSSSAFVNPADTYNRARVADNYLWQVVRKLVGYRYQAPGVEVDEAVTVVRVVIARDGRLIDVQIAQSSGIPQIDAGVIGGVRRGSPYAPLPDNIQGASATFFLPLVSVNRQ